jgi:hypothetical protein
LGELFLIEGIPHSIRDEILPCFILTMQFPEGFYPHENTNQMLFFFITFPLRLNAMPHTNGLIIRA